LAFWRDLFASSALALVFAVFAPRLLRIERRHWVFFVIYGLLVAVFNSLWTVSVKYNGAAVATVLAYSSAAFTAILARLLFKETLGVVKLLAVALALVGSAMVSGAYLPSAWQTNFIGLLTGLVSGMMFAGYSLFGKAAALRGVSSWTALMYSFGAAALFLLFFNLVPMNLPEGMASPLLFSLGARWDGWAYLLVLAVAPTVAGFGLYTASLAYLPASVANLIATLEPVLTAILAFFLLGEVLTLIQIMGGLLIISAVVALRLYERR
ncbi:MAG: DMT family transporter, partial [Chloroflexi bacterium]|nr:DMT family transporter [Chloroflexota bacterium]